MQQWSWLLLIFIYKKDGKEESSGLAAYIDEIEVDDDWTTNLK